MTVGDMCNILVNMPQDNNLVVETLTGSHDIDPDGIYEDYQGDVTIRILQEYY